jgi:hypothetical protein
MHLRALVRAPESRATSHESIPLAHPLYQDYMGNLILFQPLGVSGTHQGLPWLSVDNNT